MPHCLVLRSATAASAALAAPCHPSAFSPSPPLVALARRAFSSSPPSRYAASPSKAPSASSRSSASPSRRASPIVNPSSTSSSLSARSSPSATAPPRAPRGPPPILSSDSTRPTTSPANRLRPLSPSTPSRPPTRAPLPSLSPRPALSPSRAPLLRSNPSGLPIYPLLPLPSPSSFSPPDPTSKSFLSSLPSSPTAAADLSASPFSSNSAWKHVYFLDPSHHIFNPKDESNIASLTEGSTPQQAFRKGEEVMRYQWISLGQDWITFFAGTGLLFLAGAALSVEGKGKETQMSPPYSTLDNAPPTDSFSSGSTPLSDARDFFNRLCDYPYKASVLIPIALLPIISLGMSAPPIMHHTHHQLMRQSPIHLWSHMWSHGSAPHWMSNIIPLVSIYGFLTFAYLLPGPERDPNDTSEPGFLSSFLARPPDAVRVSTYIALLPIFVLTTGAFASLIRSTHRTFFLHSFGRQTLLPRLSNPTLFFSTSAEHTYKPFPLPTGPLPTHHSLVHLPSSPHPRLLINVLSPSFPRFDSLAWQGLSEVLAASGSLLALTGLFSLLSSLSPSCPSDAVTYAPLTISLPMALWTAWFAVDNVLLRFRPEGVVKMYGMLGMRLQKSPKELRTRLPMAHLPGMAAGVMFFFFWHMAWNYALEKAWDEKTCAPLPAHSLLRKASDESSPTK